SAMKRTALGLMTPDGLDPALIASTASPPCMRANASAIWLRLAFSTHTKRTRFIREPQQQADLGPQQAPSTSGVAGCIAATSGVQLPPEVAQASPIAW